MSKKILLTLVLALTVALALSWLLHPKSSPLMPSRPVDASDQSVAPKLREVAPHVVPSPAQPLAGKRARTTDAHAASPSEDVARYLQSVKEDPAYDWKQPIDFYGKVVDEHNRPVDGASVQFTWSSISELATNGTLTKRTETDNSGSFVIHETGKRLSITVAKEGFYTTPSETLRTYEYANPGDGLFTPDPASPVVFHLFKKGEAAQLIHGLKLFGSRVDGTLSYVDLTTAKAALTPPGDLTVQCTRSERNADKKFDWTFTLGVPGGGLIESTNEFMLSAPDSGYQPSFQITHRINDPDWTGQEKHRFFVRSQDGQHYARLAITIMPDYSQNAAYDVEWFLNPTGSRNLEYDPASAVQATP